MKSNELLNPIYGDFIETLEEHGGSIGESLSSITQTLSIISEVTFIPVIVIIAYRMYLWILTTTRSGMPGAGTWQAFIMPASFFLAAGLLIPMPTTNISSIQMVAYKSIAISNVLGEKTYNIISDDLVTKSTLDLPPDIGSREAVNNMFKAALCANYIVGWSGEKEIEKRHNQFILGSGKCGTISSPILPDNHKNKLLVIETAIADLYFEMRELAKIIIDNARIYDETGASSDSYKIAYLLDNDNVGYENFIINQLSNSAKRYNNAIRSTVLSGNKEFEISTNSWVEAGAIWQKLIASQKIGANLVTEINNSISYRLPGDIGSKNNDGNYLALIRYADVLLEKSFVFNNTTTETTKVELDPARYCSMSGCSIQDVESNFNKWISTNVIHGLRNPGNDPLTSFVTTGNELAIAARKLYFFQIALSTLHKIPIIGGVTETVAAFIEKNTEKLEEASIKLSVWLPSLPVMIWILSITMWVIGSIYIVAAAPFFCIGLAMPPSDGSFLSPLSSRVLSQFVGIIIMPPILIIGLHLSVAAFNVVIPFAVDLFWQIEPEGSSGTMLQAIGRIALFGISLFAVSAIVLMATIYKLFSFLANLFGGATTDSNDVAGASSSGGELSQNMGGMGAASAQFKRGSSVAKSKGSGKKPNIPTKK